MEIRFDNQVVIITGASAGIGKAAALAYAKSGAKVVVNYRKSKEAAEEVVQQIQALGGEALGVQADVSKQGEVERLISATLDAYQKIDILVNNAGTLVGRTTIEETSEEHWDKVMEVNLKSAYLCAKAVIPIMRKQQQGNILNITSVAARNGGGIGAGHYAAAKAGMLTLTKNLAKELAPYHIRVNAIAPGVITTLYHDKFTKPEARENFKKAIPLGREGTPEEVAYGILFMSSAFAEYIIGETLEINGGILMD